MSDGGLLGRRPDPPAPSESEEPPSEAGERESGWVGDHDHATRDSTPALGTHGQPGGWKRAREGASVALARRGYLDAAWSYIFGSDTGYAAAEPAQESTRAAGRRQREGELKAPVHGPLIKGPVWTWEVPLYFWFGGIASGSSFVALACDLAGDHRSAVTARKVALAAVAPCPPLLVMDLGRPERFLNMLRVFKPRSPMSMGAWALTLFGNLAAAAVAADLMGRKREARAMGAANAAVAGYLGSYTGVLLAVTAVPLWARSRLFLGPIFVCTATATGAAATRLTLVATGVPAGHPTRTALGNVEAGAMFAELALSMINEKRLGRFADTLEQGHAGKLFTLAKWSVRAGLASRLLRGRGGPRVHHAASALYLGAGLAFRYAWVEAGKASARDHDSVAAMARPD